MTHEATIDPLQSVPHRVKVFKLIYGSVSRDVTTEDNQRPDDVNTRREPLTHKFMPRHADEFKRTKHFAELR